ncbi:sodium:proton antiporter [Parvibaculum sp.]|uniref:cation:proton antiporter n=1 Tax=Parvibaculum sp. TaxID=2024848 RepID=UPI00272F61FD|nr:cation:proton antiporter [Parvibaculum sp.]MDP1627831.1 cation:proton antiporter [Parvibaculum sp.]MDP2150829.1 cation:proton antiporter [Parvibaculum sp.]MDP3327626.1 cation:proton antiporter [Parvibaculum sp.]
MDAYDVLVAVALLIVAYGLVSGGRIGRYVTGPMVFTAAGAGLAAIGLGGGEGAAATEIANQTMRLLAEFGLAILLFTDAARINPSHLKQEENLPARLLLAGLPGAVLIGFLAAWLLFPGEAWWCLALIALILAPTDAALAQSAIANPQMPETVSQTLNVESGLNDGLVLPPILIVFGIAAGHGTEQGIAATLAGHLILGPLAGAAIGYGGGWLVRRAANRREMTPLFQRLSAPALAVIAYAGAEAIGGNGFIAAFAAGLMMPLTLHTDAPARRLEEFAEAEAGILTSALFLLFGALILPIGVPHWDFATLLYAVLSLTLVRMLPVALSLVGTGLGPGAVGLLAWFGPRGIASVLYLLLAVQALGGAEGGQEALERLTSVVSLTVFISIFLHGLSAAPLAALYLRHKGPRGRRG